MTRVSQELLSSSLASRWIERSRESCRIVRSSPGHQTSIHQQRWQTKRGFKGGREGRQRYNRMAENEGNEIKEEGENRRKGDKERNSGEKWGWMDPRIFAPSIQLLLRFRRFYESLDKTCREWHPTAGDPKTACLIVHEQGKQDTEDRQGNSA